MKLLIQTILALAFLILVLCLPSQGQTNANKPEQKMVMPPDSIAIVSLRDYNTFFTFLQENMSKSAYDKLTPDKVLIEFFNWAIVEWNRKKKK